MMIDKNQIRQLYVAIVGNLTLFVAGIHMGWAAPSIPRLLSPEFPFEITNDEASYIVISSFIGVIIGSLLTFVLVDKIGRKRSIILFTTPLILSFIFISISFLSKELLYLARILGGVCEGGFIILCGMYVSEISEPRIRGTLTSFAPITWMTGIIMVNIVSSFLTLYQAALFYISFPCLYIVLLLKIPETPYYYLMKKQTKEAETALKYLLNKPNVEKEIENLTNDVNRQMSEPGNFKDIFTIDSNRKAFFILVGVRVFQQYTGCTAIGYYAQTLLKNAIPSMLPVVSSSIMFTTQLLVSSFATFFVDKFGRRPLFISSCSGCFLTLLMQGIYFTLRDYTKVNTDSFELLPLVCVVFFVVAFALGLGSLMSLIISEMFSQSVKARAVCLINIVYACCAFTSTKFYQFTSDAFGMAVPFYSFACFSFFGILLFTFALPETKGKTLEEIQQELKGNKKAAL